MSKSTRFRSSWSGEECKPFIDDMFSTRDNVSVIQITGRLLSEGFNTTKLDFAKPQRDLFQLVNDIMRHGMNKQGWPYEVAEGEGPSTVWGKKTS